MSLSKNKTVVFLFYVLWSQVTPKFTFTIKVFVLVWLLLVKRPLKSTCMHDLSYPLAVLRSKMTCCTMFYSNTCHRHFCSIESWLWPFGSMILVNKFGENARDLLNVGYLLRQLYMWCSLVKSESAYCTKCLASCSGILVLFGMVQSLFALTVTSTKKSQISYCRSLYNHMLCSIIWTLLIHLKVWVHGFLRD